MAKQNLYEYLSDGKVYCKDVSYILSDNVVCVDIEGDWKHDHWRADYLLEQAGYRKLFEEEYGYSDSDYYCSVHKYLVPDHE